MLKAHIPPIVLICTLLTLFTPATHGSISSQVDFTTSCAVAGGLLLFLQQKQDMVLKNPGFLNMPVAPTSFAFSSPLLLATSVLLFSAAIAAPMQEYTQDEYGSPKEVTCRNFAAKVVALCGLAIAGGTFAVDYLGFKMPFTAPAQ